MKITLLLICCFICVGTQPFEDYDYSENSDKKSEKEYVRDFLDEMNVEEIVPDLVSFKAKYERAFEPDDEMDLEKYSSQPSFCDVFNLCDRDLNGFTVTCAEFGNVYKRDPILFSTIWKKVAVKLCGKCQKYCKERRKLAISRNEKQHKYFAGDV
uniref:uncharacterized protein LOC120337721 n=1 Tax=Styela clava TaxID=7725 RepID=UPI00193ADF57|nr:uncharacterized protein LOC120337721 [Styela clava]